MRSTLSQFLLYLQGVHLISGVSFQEFVTLSFDQKQKLEEVLVNDKLPHDYMKNEDFLIRFLREEKFDTNGAERLLLKTLKWRKDNDIDNILKEDWSYFNEEYKASIEGCDKEGKPVASFYLRDWDVRKAVIAGYSETLNRYVYKLFEQSEAILRAMVLQGHNATQATFLFDVKEFNIAQQTCSRCMTLLFQIFSSLRYWPQFINKVYIINAPQLLYSPWEIAKQFLPKNTQRLIDIYGTNKKEWAPFLLESIDPMYLSRDFGGSNEYGPVDLQYMHNQFLAGRDMQCNATWQLEYFLWSTENQL